MGLGCAIADNILLFDVPGDCVLMYKHLLFRFTLASQVAVIVLLLAILGTGGMVIAGWLGQGIQGSAHAINTAGTLRMQSYRLLAAVPLSTDDEHLFNEMRATVFSPTLAYAARRDNQTQSLQALQLYWENELAPALRSARQPQPVSQKVALFVGRIDQLVSAFDRTTETRIERAVLIQKTLAGLMAFLCLFTLCWLRKRLLRPWKTLLSMANAIGQRDFSQRISTTGHDEMATLGQAFNSMACELAESYGVLEARVREKTAGLEQKNQLLSFLWRANQCLHSRVPMCQRVAPVLNELQQLTPLRDIELRIYEHEDEEHYQEFSYQASHDCQVSDCMLCPRNSVPLTGPCVTRSWRLQDSHNLYGVLLARLPEGNQLSHDQHHLMETLAEHITASLAIERQQDHQQQLMVMQERGAIARELHDSIAQSLSCMKMQVSCLQMQGHDWPAESRTLLEQIRGELNTSWRQLRELLTTFRLQLNEPGLKPALEASCEEFSLRLGFKVTLDYRLAPRRVPAHQAIHLVQIAREALNNSLKHARASEMGVQVDEHDDQVRMIVYDNGCGIPPQAGRANHYGLVIMRDRAQSLGAEYAVRLRETGGTEVVVSFIPEAVLA